MATAQDVEEKVDAMYRSGRRNIAKALGDEKLKTTDGREVMLGLDRKMLAVNKAAEKGSVADVEDAAGKLHKSLFRELKKALGDDECKTTNGRSQLLELDRKWLAVSKTAEG